MSDWSLGNDSFPNHGCMLYLLAFTPQTPTTCCTVQQKSHISMVWFFLVQVGIQDFLAILLFHFGSLWNGLMNQNIEDQFYNQWLNLVAKFRWVGLRENLKHKPHSLKTNCRLQAVLVLLVWTLCKCFAFTILKRLFLSPQSFPFPDHQASRVPDGCSYTNPMAGLQNS